MKTNDDLLNYLFRIRLPKYRGEREFCEFVSKELEEYIKCIKELSINGQRTLSEDFYIKLSKLIPLIEDTASAVNTSLAEYDKTNYATSYSIIFNIMDRIYKSIEFVNIKHHYSHNSFFRVREVEYERSDFSRFDIFHTPFDKRAYVPTSRFSLPGMPSLYLSSAPELCWFESNLPNNFYIAEFEFANHYTRHNFKLLDFTHRPLHLSIDTNLAILNQKKEELSIREKILIEFLTMYPLRLASSIAVETKGTPFIHEYVVPQMILAWVNKTNLFHGIKFTSATYTKEAHDYNAYNIVLPIKELGLDGRCNTTAKYFKISKPEYYNINQFFNKSKILEASEKILEYFSSEHLKGNYSLHEIENLLFTLYDSLKDIIKNSNAKNKALYRVVDSVYSNLSNITHTQELFNKYLYDKSSDSYSEENAIIYYQKLRDFLLKELSNINRFSFLRMNKFEDFQLLYPYND